MVVVVGGVWLAGVEESRAAAVVAARGGKKTRAKGEGEGGGEGDGGRSYTWSRLEEACEESGLLF